MDKKIFSYLILIMLALGSLSCTDEDKIAAGFLNNDELSEGTPVPFLIDQNYPNPFNPTTRIPFHVVIPMLVTIKVFTEDWQEVVVLIHEPKAAGYYSVDFYAEGLPSGEYYYTMEGRGYTEVRKMKLVK